MNKSTIVAMAVAVLAVTQAQAAQIYIDVVNGYNESGYQNDGGGEFNISGLGTAGYSALDIYNNNNGQSGFGTFCIAKSITVDPGHTYTGTIDPTGINPATSQQITEGTAWLFQQFATGALSDFNYTPGITRDVADFNLQNAIWYLEGQITLTTPLDNTFLNDVNTEFGSLSAAETADNGQFGVGVLDLSYSDHEAQPQLVLVPAPPSVPDGGATMLLLGMSLSSLALVSRKLRA